MASKTTPTHSEVQKKIDRLEDKVDSRLDKIEGKVDQIVTTMEANTRTLEEHVRRTNLLEEQVSSNREEVTVRLKNLEEAHASIISIPDKIYKFAKWVTTISALISLFAGLAHLAIRILMG